MAAGALALSLPAVVSAGPVEDGQAAAARGDYGTAMRLWRPKAEHGHSQAEYDMGVLYDNGWGAPQDFATARMWYLKAADQGVAKAQFNLAVLYEQGLGGGRDYAAAIGWYRKAADQGDNRAQYSLGSMYANARGAPQDYGQAFYWYRKAADQGHVRAQFNLGVLYANGWGTSRDDAAAALWYRKAADQGKAGAQNNLGMMYAAGLGVPKDYVQAHMWYSLAAAHPENAEGGDTAVKNRDTVAAMMTAAQIADAQRMASAWKPATVAQSATTAPSSAPNPATTVAPSRADADPMPYYPVGAVRGGVQGEVGLSCGMNAHAALKDCKVRWQSPQDAGLGVAALAMAARSPDNPAVTVAPRPGGEDVVVRFCLRPPSITPNLLLAHHIVVQPVVTRAPSAAEINRAYPGAAHSQAVSGLVGVRCPVRPDGAVRPCSVVFEVPGSHGFAAAAVSLSSMFRATPLTVDDQPSSGGWIQTSIGFGANPPPPPAPMPPSMDQRCRNPE